MWKLLQVDRCYYMSSGSYYRWVRAITCGAEAITGGFELELYMWVGVGAFTCGLELELLHVKW